MTVEGSTVEVPAVLVDTQAAAVAVSVSPATVRSWAFRGYLVRAGTLPGSGRPALWDLGQVYSVAAAFARGERPEKVAARPV
ncbi:MerR-like helix-turn-helix DNA binding domain protein [Arthrobacter phage Kepler]|uniref:MerR-like helix-turn-helix DNA binding domain protein n=5 Tax=Coralvirus TaxID=2733171 RepID=A0A3G2KFI0_9CAUD|nr:MerR-like helix-turn-helix DNA binding domain protein [Arthrobacter phage Coral]YP_009815903.1 MerR-like helix-turn-helix DNA binding domain protein [Arthrobacter phage Kepler]AYN57717.1 MerR-like helix-turn-helix DNA binding domain protein [Arthrobacter phage Daob]AYN58617.1 MerR-like helix-turn-helix DNA binding domain protein [Arthrobacter phage Melons]AYN58825.1 MerR-like helix-turn-helix DNA binding domain protein [Arthrobacter phage Polka]AYN57546.1 MerR-like helix-turn-helix DNA bind